MANNNKGWHNNNKHNNNKNNNANIKTHIVV